MLQCIKAFTACEPLHAVKMRHGTRKQLFFVLETGSTSFSQTVAALISVAVARASAGSLRPAGWPPAKQASLEVRGLGHLRVKGCRV